jgi:hypothetical protein
MSTPVGFSQESTGSPARLPTGTRPDAMPPTAAPRKNGTSTDDSANVAPIARASRIVAAWPRRANAVPRKMIPIAARKSGIESVENSDPKATGNAVHTITSTKMSQTWLASHTGLIDRCTMPRTRPPRSAPPAVRSHRPAPKSAPPSTA